MFWVGKACWFFPFLSLPFAAMYLLIFSHRGERKSECLDNMCQTATVARIQRAGGHSQALGDLFPGVSSAPSGENRQCLRIHNREDLLDLNNLLQILYVGFRGQSLRKFFIVPLELDRNEPPLPTQIAIDRVNKGGL